MIAATLAPGLTVNLNLLETFLLVAEHSSFRAAGVRIGEIKLCNHNSHKAVGGAAVGLTLPSHDALGFADGRGEEACRCG